MSWPARIVGAHRARFSASVLPVTVRHRRAAGRVEQRLHAAARMPPIATSSAITYLPLGLQVGEHRHALADAREVVERRASRRRLCAIASRCSTALVDPPSAMTTVIAFSNALRVRMSRGLMPRSQQPHHGGAGARGSRRAWRPRSPPAPSCSAGSGRAPRSPRPWCWPCTCRRRSPRPGWRCARSPELARRRCLPAACRPTASNTETMSRPCPAAARPDRAAVDEDRRTIEPCDRHRAARHVLVAAADGDQPVEALGADHGLDRVGDHLARHERVAHARRCPSRCRRRP